MICNNCGTNNPDGVKFCNKCGAPLTAPAQPVAPVQPQAPIQPQAPVQPQAPKKNNKGLIIGIVAGVVALIAIVAVVLLVAFKDKGKDSEKDDGSSKAKVEESVKDNKEDNPVTPVDTKHDSKLVGKWLWNMSMEEEGVPIEFNAYLEFKADGTSKVTVDEDEIEQTMTDLIYDTFNNSLGGSYTRDEIDQLLAQAGEQSVQEVVNEAIADMNMQELETEGYWETEDGKMYAWNEGETKDTNPPDEYTVSADGKTVTVVSDDMTIVLEKV